MSSFRRNVRHVLPGEDVSAGVTGRATRDLEGSLAYLKELFELAVVGQALFAREVEIDATLLKGQAVYWNATTARWEAALAGVETDSTSGSLVPTAKSIVTGVLASKEDAPTIGNVLLMGMVELDIAEAIDETLSVGWYYLSSQTAGHLTKQRPPVSIPVLFALGDGRVIVSPSYKDFLSSHVHFEFELVNRPAGDHTPPDLDDPHAEHFITDGDSDLAGWLPADHEVFDGAAPVGAAFGYNLTGHPELQRIWPPIPLTACALVLDRPYFPGSAIRLGGTLPLKHTAEHPGDYVIDSQGIWWMQRRAGYVPWDPEIDTTSDPDGGSSLSEGGGFYPTVQRCFLAFAQSLFANSSSVVTKLTGITPIEVTGCNGEEASTGALQVAIDLSLTTTDDAPDGGLAVKVVDGTAFQRGWVTEGIVAGAGVELSSTHQSTIDDEEVHQGVVTISSTLGTAAAELPAQLIRLDDVEERYYSDVTYLGFREARESSIRVKFHVPPGGLAESPKLTLRLVLLGRAAGSVPTLTATYRRVARPTADTALPLTDSAVTLNTAETISNANEYFEKESDEIAVAAGDTVFVTISRADDDGYASEVGLLRIGGVLS